MDSFIKLSIPERNPYFLKASELKGIPVHIIEKDFWVCWTLKNLFSIPEIKDHLTFKGGTSLSKVYRIIERFSEDIDISIHKEYLGFSGIKDPANAKSGKEAKKLIQELNKTCKNFIQNKLLDLLENRFLPLIPKDQQWSLKIDENDPDGQTILFYYPAVTKSEYIRPAVKIEFGARAEHWPISIQEIEAYLTEVLPTLYPDKKFKINVLNAERTFWEKATILHMYANYPTDKIIPVGQSRHYYDFYCLLNSPVKNKALVEISLLKKVCEHKKLYFNAAWAKYEEAGNGNLKLIPPEKILNEMRKDFTQMSEMFFGKIPPWNDIVEAISQFKIYLK